MTDERPMAEVIAELRPIAEEGARLRTAYLTLYAAHGCAGPEECAGCESLGDLLNWQDDNLPKILSALPALLALAEKGLEGEARCPLSDCWIDNNPGAPDSMPPFCRAHGVYVSRQPATPEKGASR